MRSAARPRGGVERFLTAIEVGRRSAYVNVGVSIALAIFTGLRFIVLVRGLSPASYGVLNVFATLAVLAPQLTSLGISLQYQRIAHHGGAGRVRHLLLVSVVVTALGILPTFPVVFILGLPLVTRGELWLVALAVTIISGATVLAVFVSQILIGRGRRSASAILMFAVNSGPTVALLPNLLLPPISVVAQLTWWAVGALIFAVLAWLLAMTRRLPADHAGERVSFGEGLLALPAQIGPWLFLFVIRYLIGINVDAAAVANYAMAAISAETAFLIAGSLLNYTTVQVMTGSQSPWRGLRYILPFYVVLTALGLVAIAWVLPIIGQGGYHLPAAAAILLAISGVVRLYILAWRPRAIGLKRLHYSSWAFLAVTAVGAGALWMWAPIQYAAYALVTVVGFLFVAVVQRITVRA